MKNDEIKTKDKEFRKLEVKHVCLQKRRHHHQFKIGNCFYIVYDPFCKYLIYKIGFTHDINFTLKAYRRIAPNTRILFLTYAEDALFIETCIKKKFEKNLTHNNHETIINIDLQEIILSVKFFVNNFNMSIEYEENDNLQKYNKIVSISNIPETLDDSQINDHNYEPEIQSKKYPAKEEIEELLDLTCFIRPELQTITRKFGHANVSKNKDKTKMKSIDLINLIKKSKQKMSEQEYFELLLNTYHERGIPTKYELNKVIFKLEKTSDDIEYIEKHLTIFNMAELQKIGTKIGIPNVSENINGNSITKIQLIDTIVNRCKNHKFDDDFVALNICTRDELRVIGKKLGMSNISRNENRKKINISELIHKILVLKKELNNDPNFQKILSDVLGLRKSKTEIFDKIISNDQTEESIQYITKNIKMFTVDELKDIGRKIGLTNVTKDEDKKKFNKEQIIEMIISKIEI